MQQPNIFIALDYPTGAEALGLVQQLGPEVTHYKVGLQLLTAGGPEVVKTLVAQGKTVFLDLKLHEIPNSVVGAVRAAGELGVSFVTVHASGGGAILRAAVDAAKEYPNLRILALTVITSLSDDDLPEIGLAPDVTTQVRRLAALAQQAGCAGVVASPHEVEMLRQEWPGAYIVTPGLAAANEQSDHRRAASPEQAAHAGPDAVIVGRGVTTAADPVGAFWELQEMLRRQM